MSFIIDYSGKFLHDFEKMVSQHRKLFLTSFSFLIPLVVSETSSQYSKRKQKEFQSKIITPFMKVFIASFYLKLIQLMSEAGKLCTGRQNGNVNRNCATSSNNSNYNQSKFQSV